VKAHVKAIMGKLEASSRTQAVSVAVQRGLVALQMPEPAMSTPAFMTGQRAAAWPSAAFA
jgi:ferric-dicitrate binding protein FerR (iron transport regulator)